MTPRSKVLLIDDDEVLTGMLGEHLIEAGYAVEVANDGVQGVERAKVETPDLIVLDVMMPEMDGWSVLQGLPAIQRPPVIMLTAKEHEFDKLRAFKLGVDDYITKPFGDLELVASSVCRAREKQCLAERTQQLEQRLAHSDRLAAIGQLAAGVAHEINNPMGFIHANLAQMAEYLDDLRRVTVIGLIAAGVLAGCSAAVATAGSVMDRRRTFGALIAAGTPEEIVQVPASHTGKYLRPLLDLPSSSRFSR